MRQLKKLFFVPATLLLLSSCGGSSKSDLDKMPVYPDPPPPPFRSELTPTQLYSYAESNFTCLVNENSLIDIKCWGANNRGQSTGTGLSSESAPISLIPNLPKFLTDPSNGSQIINPDDGKPVALTIKATAVGKEHACVALSDSSIWCWGDNSSGQIDGTLDIQVLYPTTHVGEDTNLPSIALVNTLAAGNAHTCAGFGDEVWCWGDNSEGQSSGDGIPTSTHEFINVTDKAQLPVNTVLKLAAGHNFTCVAFEDNGVWCWGMNDVGQVSGEPIDSLAHDPSQTSFATAATQVQGLPTGKILSLTAGYNHACAALEDGNIWCWGNDKNAQVSGIRKTRSLSPGLTLVQGIPKDVLALSSGANFTCAAFKTKGNLWCWGNNEHSTVDGNGIQGSTEQRITFVPSIYESVILAAGAKHMCAAFTDGEVSCWGNDTFGQVSGGGVSGNSYARATSLSLRK